MGFKDEQGFVDTVAVPTVLWIRWETCITQSMWTGLNLASSTSPKPEAVAKPPHPNANHDIACVDQSMQIASEHIPRPMNTHLEMLAKRV